MRSLKLLTKLNPVAQVALIVGIFVLLVLVATVPSAGPNLLNFIRDLVTYLQGLRELLQK